MNSNSNVFKYIFAAVVAILIGYIMYIIVQNRSNVEDYNLDQTSKMSNIQTDLRLAIAGFDTINPILSTNRNVQEISKIIFEPLITLNSTYKKEYCLAKEVAKVEPNVYLIKVRDDVKWSDGSDFNIYDVIYTVDMIKSGINTIYSENVRAVVEIEQIDDYTMKMYLSEDVPFFEYNLTFPIMCQAYYQDQDFATSEKVPIGTGMFRISVQTKYEILHY